MKTLNKESTEIFCLLIEKLNGKQHLKIENEPFMPLVIEKIGDAYDGEALLYSFCHYYKQNGDLMQDPEVCFVLIDGRNDELSFVEYGGVNLLHYEFDHEFHTTEKQGVENKIEAYFINSNVFLLADNDLKKEKHLPFENINRPNFVYCQTEVPEIENVLPDIIIKGYFRDVFRYEDSVLDKCFPVKDGVKLGRHFTNKLPYGKRFRITEADGGTLKSDYKKGLANYVHKKVLEGTLDWKHLQSSPFLSKNIPLLYEFINKRNRIVE